MDAAKPRERILDCYAPGLTDLWRLDDTTLGLRDLGEGAKPLLDEFLGGGGLEIPRERQRGVRGGVPLAEKPLDVIHAATLEVLVKADSEVAIRVAFRVECGGRRESILAIRHVVVTLAALVSDDVTLVRQAFLGDRLRQIAHPLAFEPECDLELVRGDDLVVVGPVRVRGAVGVGAPDLLEDLEVLVLARVLRALEHHVLEEVREAALAGHLVAAADVVPQIDGHEGHGLVLVEDDLQSVGQGVFLERDLGVRKLRAGDGLRADVVGERRNGQSEDDSEDQGPGSVACLHEIPFRQLPDRWCVADGRRE